MEYKLSIPLLITLFSGITLAYTNIKIFVVIIAFTATYLPRALRFFTKLAKMEQDKQDSWYNLFGIVADCITNIFTIFSFATKRRELNKIEDYYHNVHNPLTIRYYKYDLIICVILSLVYWVYLTGVFVYVIHLRNLGEIGIGDIIIDNQSIYDTSSDSLREQISLIPQDIMLFHRSIAENIGYAKENAELDEIKNAAKAANIHEFIESLPEKYNTIVGERGVKLSGGQRQRIAIARAILKNAPILVLDEATSSLDSHTEQEVQKSINTMLDIDNVTIIAIAHRLSTIKHMDRIIVMDKGKIVENGTFMELVRKEKGKFKELWEHQVNGFV